MNFMSRTIQLVRLGRVATNTNVATISQSVHLLLRTSSSRLSRENMNVIYTRYQVVPDVIDTAPANTIEVNLRKK